MILLIDNKQIYDFALKWYNKFCDFNTDFVEIMNQSLADECDALGFVMDNGCAFSKEVGNALNDYETLEKVIDDVTDISLLGSAIYSKWNAFHQSGNTKDEIASFHHRMWFILTFQRLLLLIKVGPFLFKGELQKIRIVSNNCKFGPRLDMDEETEQRITINNEGRVWFSGYNDRCVDRKYKKLRSKTFKIEKQVADRIFSTISNYFKNGHEEIIATDVGLWWLELTNTEGITYQYSGPLCVKLKYNGINLSDLIREATDMDDLFVFDGDANIDRINKITIDYRKIIQKKTYEGQEGRKLENFICEHTERLVIDRETNVLEHIQNMGTKCKITHKYEVEGGIEELLEDFDSEDLFSYTEGNPADVIEIPSEKKEYTIRIDYKSGLKRVLNGTYDQKGLPQDFSYFMESIRDFMHDYGKADIFDPAIYDKRRRCQSEYIFCKVTFEDGYRKYYYLTDDESIQIGDLVMVPVGEDNHQSLVEVVDIDFFTKENAPFPIEKTKYILYKYGNEAFK